MKTQEWSVTHYGVGLNRFYGYIISSVSFAADHTMSLMFQFTKITLLVGHRGVKIKLSIQTSMERKR